jgi:Tfp pilus assembly protein PilW
MPTKITRYKLSGTTDASGDATVQGTKVVRGKILAILCDLSDCNNTADSTITTTDEATTQTILSLTNVGADTNVYPKVLATDYENGALTVTGNIYTEYVVFSRLKAVVAQGGNGKNFTFDIVVEEY